MLIYADDCDADILLTEEIRRGQRRHIREWRIAGVHAYFHRPKDGR